MSGHICFSRYIKIYHLPVITQNKSKIIHHSGIWMVIWEDGWSGMEWNKLVKFLKLILFYHWIPFHSISSYTTNPNIPLRIWIALLWYIAMRFFQKPNLQAIGISCHMPHNSVYMVGARTQNYINIRCYEEPLTVSYNSSTSCYLSWLRAKSINI